MVSTLHSGPAAQVNMSLATVTIWLYHKFGCLRLVSISFNLATPFLKERHRPFTGWLRNRGIRVPCLDICLINDVLCLKIIRESA